MTERARIVRQLRELQHIKLDGLRFRVIDAKGLIVGRIAADIATILQGKDKPTYTPKKNTGDVVIVINAAHVHFTHDKWDTKLYRWHTGHPGGLKSLTAVQMWEKNPTRIITEAVAGMLPKNKMRPYRMDKLKVFAGPDHPFTDFPLVPYVPKPRAVNIPGIGWPLPEGLQPMNPERYGFRVRASPGLAQLQQQALGAPPAAASTSAAQAAAPKAAGAPATGKAAASTSGSGSSGEATAGPRSAQVAAGAQSGIGLSGFEDLLTAAERAALASELQKEAAAGGSSSSKAAGQQKSAGGEKAQPAGKKGG